MARRKQPIEIAKLKGSYKIHPERYAGEIPKSNEPLSVVPKHLSAAAKKVWQELRKLALPGTVTASDSLALEVFADLVVEYRSDPQGFTSAKYSSLLGCISRFGMSPADRMRLAVVKPKGGSNEFDQF